ncbi:uracil phosphoribosyltransferase [Aestuariicella hydrocarbonica]|uniref:Uracil phosphoribosyltransferase n=1 Tax=Pseudomaricurvus hydrocarbonicus TaxID=1470433 RepID=A0A9E5MP26_9GAMM|nr:uracil phosphoribosyltransferase [Aestuariicella hydrocarbonica]NHO67820.1 uracil phosphoribosyltransferase [Aestuariicella hydrocarbonica]
MKDNVVVIDHPLIQHKLSIMRNRGTASGKFRHLLKEISLLMGYEATRDLPTTYRSIETPMEAMDAPVLSGKKMCLFSVLRAGDGLLSGLLELVPSARVGHIGLYRDPKTLEAVEYFFKAPKQLNERLCLVVDPMLATGHSASAAIQKVKDHGGKHIRFICLLASPEGLQTLADQHPDVKVYTACIDRACNDKGYILPGIGDAGDRLFGTSNREH